MKQQLGVTTRNAGVEQQLGVNAAALKQRLVSERAVLHRRLGSGRAMLRPLQCRRARRQIHDPLSEHGVRDW